jgi:hypothetical protein
MHALVMFFLVLITAISGCEIVEKAGSDSGAISDADADSGADSDADSDAGPIVGGVCIVEDGTWADADGTDGGGSAGVLDCVLSCVPEAITMVEHEYSYLGDGYCDDGTWEAYLDCAEFSFDGGDCADTGI